MDKNDEDEKTDVRASHSCMSGARRLLFPADYPEIGAEQNPEIK